ncbi:SGNH/GDSL hydrolase family protein [Undibacterium sp. Ji42W]|uniref:SGNH/GDSL hydrolase family protein n=1 Tax=Undibacterium sp. Ji42W TaxID=3413039 RepID=UPI003BF07379
MKFAYLPELVAAPLYPLLAWQGRHTRAVTPRLSEATDQAFGRWARGNSPVDKYKVLGIGESPVAGVGVANYEEAITAQLAKSLAGKLDATVAWQALGQNGARLSWARQALPGFRQAQSHASPAWDVILVAFGVNDTTSFCPVNRYRTELQSLLDELQMMLKPSGLIVLAGVPPMQVFPALPAPLRQVLGMKARALDHVNHEMAVSRQRVLHLPFTANLQDVRQMAEDGYHPSALGVSIWAEELAKTFLQNRQEK